MGYCFGEGCLWDGDARWEGGHGVERWEELGVLDGFGSNHAGYRYDVEGEVGVAANVELDRTR